MNDAQAMDEFPREGPIPDVDLLPRLVAWLGRKEWSGQVAVRSGDVERRLYLMDGHVQTAMSEDPGESMAAWLVARGLLGADDVEQAAAHLGTRDWGLGFARKLVDLGMLTEAQLAEAELDRVVDLSERILSLRSGIYRCEVVAPPADMVSHALDVPRLVATAVLGHWDETWAMNVLGGMGAVLKLNTERLPDHEATGANEDYDLTLLRVDGKSSIGTVIERSPLPELAAVRFLAACHLLGVVEAAEVAAPAAAPRRGAAPAPPRPQPPPSEPAVAAVVEESSTEGAEDWQDEGDATAPGFYRPPASAPSPRAEEPLMAEKPSGSGLGRLLLIALILGLLGVVGWFGWVGLSEMTGAGPSEPSTSEAAP